MEKKLKKLKNALGDKINDSIVERKLYSYDATAIPIEHITPSCSFSHIFRRYRNNSKNLL